MESITFRNYVLRTFGVKIDVWWENTLFRMLGHGSELSIVLFIC